MAHQGRKRTKAETASAEGHGEGQGQGMSKKDTAKNSKTVGVV